jgi:DNA-binding GntR family transcriptional regulator
VPSVWSELAEQHKTKSFRSLAREYGVSHEAVRRALLNMESTSSKSVSGVV